MAMVIWQVTERQSVLVFREEADTLYGIIEAYDAIPFVWKVGGGYQFVLLPRRRTALVN